MLIYLFVVFSFGWCVCWLIFQQYSRDSKLEELRRRRRNERMLCVRANPGAGLTSGALKRPFNKLRASASLIRDLPEQQQLGLLAERQGERRHSQEENLSAEPEEGQDECDRSQSFKFASCVVDRHGKHSILGPSANTNQPEEASCIDFPLSEYIDDEEALEEELLLQEEANCDFCPECRLERRLREEPSEVTMRGWPEELPDLWEASAVEQEEEEELFSLGGGHLWPLVKLQENPLNGADESLLGSRPRASPASISYGTESEEANRAAIRVISTDSVQLLVSAASLCRAAGQPELGRAEEQKEQKEQKEPLPAGGLCELSQRLAELELEQARCQQPSGPGREKSARAPARQLDGRPSQPEGGGQEQQLAGGQAGRPAPSELPKASPEAAPAKADPSGQPGAAGSSEQQAEWEKSGRSPGNAHERRQHKLARSPSQRQQQHQQPPPTQQNNTRGHFALTASQHLQPEPLRPEPQELPRQSECDVSRRERTRESHIRESLLTTAAPAAAAMRSLPKPKRLSPAPRDPVPTPRLGAKQPQPAALSDQLSILTGQLCLLKPRAGPSSPPSSLLSDSTLVTGQGLNSAELIPKLIERLDRKLVVMKEEQLRLSKEIETNELAGERLFALISARLAKSEFEKVELHAQEVEKVTKLILSLKLRLKKVELELKERSEHLEESLATEAQTRTSSSQDTSERLGESPYSSSYLSPVGAPTAASSQGSVVRGVSDPTSTTGLPSKRNHQHHASLQLEPLSGAEASAAGSPPAPRAKPTAAASSSPPPAAREDQAANSNSSDSIFNCTDSALGSTIGSGAGSATNIQLARRQQSAANISSQSSLSSAGRRSHLSSHLSSHSSISSVPHSPPLMSPASTSGGIGTGGSSLSGASTPVSQSGSMAGSKQQLSQAYYSSPQQPQADNNNIQPLAAGKKALISADIQAPSELDILAAKRNKLLSQLEEAHQLEECIFRRNSIIVQKILKKYYDEHNQGGEIAEFKQFTRLKSLLLKDTHDVADRIDSAQLQLTELKQSNLV